VWGWCPVLDYVITAFSNVDGEEFYGWWVFRRVSKIALGTTIQ